MEMDSGRRLHTTMYMSLFWQAAMHVAEEKHDDGMSLTICIPCAE